MKTGCQVTWGSGAPRAIVREFTVGRLSNGMRVDLAKVELVSTVSALDTNNGCTYPAGAEVLVDAKVLAYLN